MPFDFMQMSNDARKISVGKTAVEVNPLRPLNGEPFSIAFVYQKQSPLVVVKGAADAVGAYINLNFTRAVYYLTYWQSGKCRGLWKTSADLSIYWSQKQIGSRQRWVLSMLTKDGFKDNVLTVRRVPRSWIKEYNYAIGKGEEGEETIQSPKMQHESITRGQLQLRINNLEDGLKFVLNYVWKKFNEGDSEAEKCYWIGVTTLDRKPLSLERTKMIENYIEELRDTWDLTSEELNHIRLVMAKYALNATIDSHIRSEAETITKVETE
jgi:hypothetical protein